MKRLLILMVVATTVFSCSPNGKKLIALSFDDGPNTVTTPLVLDVLDSLDCKASFFLIGNNITDESAPVMKRALDLGCDIQCHSLTHTSFNQLDAEGMKKEIESTLEKIRQYSGEEPRFFRPPYLDTNPTLFETVGLTVIGGVGSEDWLDEVDARQRIERVLASAEPGQIILLHDFEGNDKTAEALKVIIPGLRAMDFEIVTVPELFRRSRIKPQKGIMYSNVNDTKQ